MALFVGLDVSLKMTSICIVDANGLAGMGGKSRKRANDADKGTDRSIE